MPDNNSSRNNTSEAVKGDAIFRLLVESVTDYAIFMLDPGGHIATWNPGAERLKGYARSEIVGKHFSTFYTPEANAKAWPQMELREAERLGRFEDEGWRVRKDGGVFWASVVISAMRDADGTLVGFSKVTRDLTERRMQGEALRQSEERFRLLLEGVQDYAIMLLDVQGRVESWNAGAQNIMGYTAEEIIGKSFALFYPPEDIAAGRPAAELREAVLHRRAVDTNWRLRKDGTRFWADVVVTALRDPAGDLVGFAKVTRDMSERKRMEALEEQGRHVTEFLAMLAHELRNPLAPIRNATSILAVSKEASPQIAWCREVIERQTSQLSRLVDDLLDVSRITRGKLQMKGEPMDLNQAVHRAIEASRPLIDSRLQTLEVAMPEESIPIHGDIARIAQVVVNLLNNAAKYTPQGGKIGVEVFSEEDDCLVRVRDNGIGIPPELSERVFDLFAQGERTLDRAEGGLGIGLTLARRIIDLHGGKITVASEGTGKGSEFTVRLPRLSLKLTQAAIPNGFEIAKGALRRSILVVDDNADSAASLAMLLTMLGHDALTEHDGPSALARFAAKRFDMVFLDIGLPGMSGYEIARKLRETPEGQGTRIYAMTGYGQEEDRRRSFDAGFDGHLVKPVASADLKEALEGH